MARLINRPVGVHAGNQAAYPAWRDIVYAAQGVSRVRDHGALCDRCNFRDRSGRPSIAPASGVESVFAISALYIGSPGDGPIRRPGAWNCRYGIQRISGYMDLFGAVLVFSG